jgi:hypothetical protein
MLWQFIFSMCRCMFINMDSHKNIPCKSHIVIIRLLLMSVGAKVNRVVQASDLALLITEWSINGNKPDGKSINLIGKGTVGLRRQSNGAWLMVIENPWGTD